jgi:predicted ArsR family transcriptional regulator
MVAEGLGTATGFAGRLSISRQAVAKHLAELERAGLAVSEKVGRESIYRPTTETMNVAMEWLAERSSQWESTLERLARHVKDDYT